MRFPVRRAGAAAAGFRERPQPVPSRHRLRTLRWAVIGTLLGSCFGLVVFAPATWLADAVATRSGGYFLLADARGTVWSGSAVAILTAGPNSRDARALPGRLEWSLQPRLDGLRLIARQRCCLNGDVALHVKAGLGGTSVALAPKPDWVAQWPAGWLAGLGTPWNTLELGGSVRLLSPGGLALATTTRPGWRMLGNADIELLDVSSRLATLAPLGSYRLAVAGADDVAGARLTLSTLDGALMLLGSGTWQARGLRFRGEARALPASEAALSNLLNIIGRRDGGRAVISIG
jgi:general secretion pathway protein N